MPTPSEIKRRAIKVSETNDELCRGRDRCQGYAYNSSQWWQSESGKALRSQYSDIEADVGRILSDLNRLESYTSSLASNVERAEEERRRRAEEQRRLAAAAAAKASKKK